MRDVTSLGLIQIPPASQDVSLPGCKGVRAAGRLHPWQTAETVLQKAIDTKFTLTEPGTASLTLAETVWHAAGIRLVVSICP